MEYLLTSSGGQDIFHVCLNSPYSLDRSPFDGAEFVALIINNDSKISNADQYALSLALVRSGCRYAVCVGHNCSTWDDSVDSASLELDPDLTAEKFVMTTWHEDDTHFEIANFFLNCTSFGNNVFENYLILSVGENETLLADIVNQCSNA